MGLGHFAVVFFFFFLEDEETKGFEAGTGEPSAVLVH